jgi:hypothetical protein
MVRTEAAAHMPGKPSEQGMQERAWAFSFATFYRITSQSQIKSPTTTPNATPNIDRMTPLI